MLRKTLDRKFAEIYWMTAKWRIFGQRPLNVSSKQLKLMFRSFATYKIWHFNFKVSIRKLSSIESIFEQKLSNLLDCSIQDILLIGFCSNMLKFLSVVKIILSSISSEDFHAIIDLKTRSNRFVTPLLPRIIHRTQFLHFGL